jgi:hypothetical protein
MANLIPVDVPILWRSRCSSESRILSGADLCVDGGPGDTSLADYRALKVDRERIRCLCDRQLLLLAPVDEPARGDGSISIPFASGGLQRSSL